MRSNFDTALALTLRWALVTLMMLACLPALAANDSPVAFLLKYGSKPAHHHSARVWHHRHFASRAGHSRIMAMVAASARRHGVPVRLALGVAHVETGFRSRWNGIAAGVMQIRPATARSVGCSGRVHDLMRPSYGVECGMRYLAAVWHHAHGRYRAAALYTQGIGARRVSRAGAHYARMVLAFR